MLLTVYRIVPAVVQTHDPRRHQLGYLTYHTERYLTTRYTPDSQLIDSHDGWATETSFRSWFRQHDELWTFDPARAYYCADPDLRMDEGL